MAAPAPTQVAPLEAVLSALRATQQALEATQTSTFGAEVTHPLQSILTAPSQDSHPSAVCPRFVLSLYSWERPHKQYILASASASPSTERNKALHKRRCALLPEVMV